jgi:protein ImuB
VALPVIAVSAPRYLVVYLPSFRLERCGYLGEERAVLTTETHQVLRVISCTPASKDLGVSLGMSLSEARALCPDIQVEQLDETAEAEDRRALLLALACFSDRLGVMDEQRLVLIIQDTAHLWQGEQGVIRAVRRTLDDLGHQCQLVIASELMTAAALARWSKGDRIVSPIEGQGALAELPLRALEPTQALVLTMEQLGLRTIGAFAALSASSIGSRFGEEGRQLHRRARAEPEQTPILTLDTLQRAQVGLVFGYDMCSTEQLKPFLPALFQQLSQQLSARSEAVVGLRCRLITEKKQPFTIWIRPGRPTRNPQRLRSLLEARLESARLEAPLVELRIDVLEAAPEPSWQLGLMNRAEAREPLPDLIARLEHTFGEERVFSARRVQRWLPEATCGRGRFPGRIRMGALTSGDVVDAQEKGEEWNERPRPNLVLSKPYPIQVELSETMTPRSMNTPMGRAAIQCAQGPERLQGEWWRQSEGFRRDYWVVDLGGRYAWIFESNARWYLHGWFD